LKKIHEIKAEDAKPGDIEKLHNKKKKKTAPDYLKYIATGLVTGAANGLFGSGGGTIAVPAMVLLLGADEHKAHATAIFIILPLTLVSVFFYIRGSYVDINLTYKVVQGGLVGGFVGAKLLAICPADLLRRIFAVFMILAGLRMIIK
jgi:uncharacterized membrane protein YfcA